MLEELPIPLLELCVGIILAIKLWSYMPARLLSASLILSTVFTFIFKLYFFINIYLLENAHSEITSSYIMALPILSMILFAVSVALGLWIVCGIQAGLKRPTAQSVSFIFILFAISLTLSIFTFVNISILGVDQYDSIQVIIRLYIIQLFTSYGMLLASFHALYAVVPTNSHPRSISKTLWLLLIPLFNLYWFFKVLLEWITIMQSTHKESESYNVTKYCRSVVNVTVFIILFAIGVTVLGVVTSSYSETMTIILGCLQILLGLAGIWLCYYWARLLLGVKKIEQDALAPSDSEALTSAQPA